MALPEMLLNRILKQFDDLIANGEAVKKAMKWIPPRLEWGSPPYISGQRHEPDEIPGFFEFDQDAMEEWLTRCVSLLDFAIPKKSIHTEWIGQLSKTRAHQHLPKQLLPKLKAMRKDIEAGLFDDLIQQLEITVASDYMSQARELLGHKESNHFDHVPAAVLAGAVLERHLRELCVRWGIATIDGNGKALMMDGLISALAKTDKIENPLAQQLRAWAAIRNKAAHGEFEAFDRQSVEGMLAGVQCFLRDCP